MPKGPRILVLNHNLRERGTYFRAWHTALAFSKRGADVAFCSTGPGRWRARAGRRDGVAIHESPQWAPVYGPDSGWSPFGALSRLGLLARPWDAVLSFSHKPVDQIPARAARAFRRAKWHCDWCDFWGGEGLNALQSKQRGPALSLRDFASDACNPVDNALERAAIAGCDLLTTISTDLQRRASDWGRSAELTMLYPSGADLRGIRPLDRARCRRALGLDPDGLYAAYVSSWHPDEALLMDALSIVRRKTPGLKVIAAGAAFATPPIRQRALGVAGLLMHQGRVPYRKLEVLLGACDFCLMPLADTEFNRSRWPNKICDYLASGRGIVACGVGDVASLSESGAAWITQPNAASFAEGIAKAASSHTQRNAFGKAARHWAESRMDWEKLAGGLWERLGF